MNKRQHKLNGFLIFMLSGFVTLGISGWMMINALNYPMVLISFTVMVIGFLQCVYALFLFKQSWDLVEEPRKSIKEKKIE